MNHEIASVVKQVNALNIQAISTDTTTNGNWIDTQGFDSLAFLLQLGTITDGDYLPLIEEADASNKSDAAAVADADLTTTEALAGFTANDDDNKVSKIGYIGNKRYVRFSIVSSNTTSGGTLGAQAILGSPSQAPVA